MEHEKLESLLIDYIDGKLNSVDKHYVEQELLKNPRSYKLYEELKEVIQLMNKRQPAEPSATLRHDFETMLASEIATTKTSKVIAMKPLWYKIAAAIAFLVVGASLGLAVSNYRQRQAQLAIAEKERARVQHVVTMIRNESSAGQRILGVKEAIEHEKIDLTLLKVLIETLNTDPNMNVRMAALDGLQKFHEYPEVRKALVESLSRQSDPVLQITLIKILVAMKEKSVVQPLKNILDSEEAISTVKDEANMGILVLS
jgi:hypothetical protein